MFRMRLGLVGVHRPEEAGSREKTDIRVINHLFAAITGAPAYAPAAGLEIPKHRGELCGDSGKQGRTGAGNGGSEVGSRPQGTPEGPPPPPTAPAAPTPYVAATPPNPNSIPTRDKTRHRRSLISGSAVKPTTRTAGAR